MTQNVVQCLSDVKLWLGLVYDHKAITTIQHSCEYFLIHPRYTAVRYNTKPHITRPELESRNDMKSATDR